MGFRNRFLSFFLVALLLVTRGANGRSPVHAISNRAILPEYVFMNFTDIAGACLCKELCLAVSGCTGATVYDHGNGVYDCLISNKKPLGYFDMKSDAAALTIRKQKAPKCDGPFTLTEVGCIMLLEELHIAKTCRRLCQSLDADLAVVEINEQQRKLWDRLKSIYNKPNFSFFWIGIEKSQWLTGVPVTTFTSPNSCGTIRENGVIRESLECAEALYCVCQRFVYE